MCGIKNQNLQGCFIFTDLQNFPAKIVQDLGRKEKDPWRSWQENERSSKILTRIWKILKEFSKIFKGSLKFLSRSLEIRTRSSKVLTGKWKILKDLGKKMKDPWRSWQELWRFWQENKKSLKILTRILKIFKGSHKDLVGLLKIIQRFSPGMCHNKAKNIESARRMCTFFFVVLVATLEI